LVTATMLCNSVGAVLLLVGVLTVGRADESTWLDRILAGGATSLALGCLFAVLLVLLH
jgi:hypothetical protein